MYDTDHSMYTPKVDHVALLHTSIHCKIVHRCTTINKCRLYMYLSSYGERSIYVYIILPIHFEIAVSVLPDSSSPIMSNYIFYRSSLARDTSD